MSKEKKHSLSEGQLDAVSRWFGVLSEKSRLQLLSHLQSGPMSVTELIQATGLKQANVSKQLGILFEAKLLEKEKEGNTVRYSIKDPMIFELCDLVCRKINRDAKETVLEFSI